MLRTTDFDYFLPEEQIAQTPAEPRDSARLLVYDRKTGEKKHAHFRDLPSFLKPGDLLVRNVTKVLPARLYGTKKDGTSKVEFLLLRCISSTEWEVILRPGKRLKPGAGVVFSPELEAEILTKGEDGLCRVAFHFEGVFEEILDRLGQIPLPPYIHDHSAPKERYQTVYARETGSAAAPTAGLHFTPELFGRLKEGGIEVADVLLHVGLGTFRPVKTDLVSEHQMHSEYYEMPQETADRINAARRDGRRIIAVGTTSVRVLESVWDGRHVRSGSGWTDIFLFPGSTFHVTDGVITNFHLPKSSLLMLVSAFAGREEILQLYQEAVEDGYRFFSFGDAMLLI